MSGINSRIGELKFTKDFENGYPTDATVTKLFDEIDFQRACQAYLWGLPIVCFAQWQYVHEETFGAKSGDIVYYPNYFSKLGLLTANATTPYALSFINLSETGPILVTMPEAEVRGAMHSMWQIPITPMTEPGQYVFYAPGTEPPITDNKKVFESPTNSMFFGIRLMSTDDGERQDALHQIKICPLDQSNNSSTTNVIEVDERWEGWQPRGLTYFERLAEILNCEPVDERDRFFHAMLKPLGIEKGKAFEPDEDQTDLLTDAALVGEAMAKANDFAKRMEAAHYNDGSHWEIATVSPSDQRWENYDALDGRAAWFYEAVTNDPAMQSTTPGEDQIYLGAYKDKDGDWLDGKKSYRLHVPPDVPAAAFWSMTVYDVSTRCLIDNPTQKGDVSSQIPTFNTNDDGSVDLYVGPKPPKDDDLKGNWVETVRDRAWFSYFRFYSPTEPYFNREWVLPDFEKDSSW